VSLQPSCNEIRQFFSLLLETFPIFLFVDPIKLPFLDVVVFSFFLPVLFIAKKIYLVIITEFKQFVRLTKIKEFWTDFSKNLLLYSWCRKLIEILMWQVFLNVALVRVKGKIMGYLNPDIGVIEVRTRTWYLQVPT
jgi:hypothetical protein